MAENVDYLGSLEETVLLAVQYLGNEAYGTTIHDELSEAKRRISIGALYVTLGRLEGKGYLESKAGEPTSERGGRAKRYFKITGAGVQVLKDSAYSREYLSMKGKGGLAWN